MENNNQNNKKQKPVWFTQADADELKKVSSMKFNIFVKYCAFREIDRLKHKGKVAEQCGHQ